MRITSGSKGKSFNDRELAGQVRSLTLNKIKQYLESDKLEDQDFKKELILRLAANTLPRINEHSGPDGGAIPISGVEIVIRK